MSEILKFSADSEVLCRLLESAARACATKGPLNGLGVLLIASKGKLTATGCDGHYAISRHTTEVQIETEGKLQFPRHAVRALPPDGAVVVEATDSGVSVTGERSEFSVPTPRADEFPAPRTPDCPVFELPVPLFRHVAKVFPAYIDENSSRYVLAGILVEPLTDGKLLLAATDAAAMIRMYVEAPGSDGLPRMVIPAPSLAAVGMQLTGAAVEFGWNETTATVKAEGLVASVPLLSGRYPDPGQAFPARQDCDWVPCSCGALLDAAQQLATLTPPDDRMYRGLVLEAREGLLVLSLEGSEYGTGSVEIPVTSDGGSARMLIPARQLGPMLTKGCDRADLLDVGVSKSGVSPLHIVAPSGLELCVMPLDEGVRKTRKAKGEREAKDEKRR